MLWEPMNQETPGPHVAKAPHARPGKVFAGRRGPCYGAKGITWSSPQTLGEISLGKKLYVGNLGYGVTSNDLEQMFAAHGTVKSAQVITDRDTGRSKGFAFVEMGADQEAQAAIAALNGKDVAGRSMTVNEARPQEPRSGGAGGFGGGHGRGGGGGGGGGYGRGGKRF